MIKQFVTSKIIHENWLIVIRVIAGVITTRYGLEIFNPDQMKGNIAWLTDLHFPLPALMAYLGKLSELVGGISLITGFLVRFTCIPLILTMGVITFIMGDGKIFGDDQHPFLFLIIYTIFLSVGSGKWSVDRLIFNRNNQTDH